MGQGHNPIVEFLIAIFKAWVGPHKKEQEKEF